MNRRFFLKLALAAPLAPIVKLDVKRPIKFAPWQAQLDLSKLLDEMYRIVRQRHAVENFYLDRIDSACDYPCAITKPSGR